MNSRGGEIRPLFLYEVVMVDRLRVNKERLWQSIEDLARLGATPQAGVCRLALSDADREGRDQVRAWIEDTGLSVQVDWAGNILAIRPGMADVPPVLMGSHLDTVDSGGRFDGAAGVLAGLEVLRRVNEERITTHHPLGLVIFTNEEGARFRTDMLGSQAFIGALNRDQVYAIRGQDGRLVGEELKRIGYAGDFPCGTIKPLAYLEMHIEQGPLLEKMGTQIGVVEAITGILWLELRLLGAANHAGTTPMDHRQDAALAAARIISALPGLAAAIPGTRATCGQVALAPGVINVIPGEAVISVDLRHGEAERLAEVERNLRRLVNEVCVETKVKVEIQTLGQVAPIQCSRAIVEEIEASCRLLGYTSRCMVSGAGHDAQFMARICPTAMIFIPSRNGISHSPKEFSSAEEVEAGANVLLQTALQLAGG